MADARDAARLGRAGVPEAWRTPRTKPEIALAEIDRAVATGMRFGPVLADAGHGTSATFRAGLNARGLLWAVGIPRILKVYPAEAVLADAAWRKVTWRRGTKGRLSAQFAAARIRVADGPAQQIGGRPAQNLPGEAAWSTSSVAMRPG